jgi:GNAT superfamily N-acetyltransferase
MELRDAAASDLRMLAEMNRALIEDEGHANPMDVAALESRMERWLAGDYRAAVVVDDGQPVGYALFRPSEVGVTLRQFFIRREQRRRGLGRAAIAEMRKTLWPRGTQMEVEVLSGNSGGLAFWRSVGFSDYSVALRDPQTEDTDRADIGARIRSLELQLLEPTVRASREALDRLLADDFVEFGSSGRIFDKAQILSELPTQPPLDHTLRDFRVAYHGATEILVTYRITLRDPTVRHGRESLRCSLWRRDDSGWRIVFHQGTPIGA